MYTKKCDIILGRPAYPAQREGSRRARQEEEEEEEQRGRGEKKLQLQAGELQRTEEREENHPTKRGREIEQQ